MSKIVYITGGARSGKSSFAEEYALEYNEDIMYIATAIPFDSGMKDRIKKHRQRRPDSWGTMEAYKGFGQKLKEIDGGYKTILFDCMTVMVTNIMLEDNEIQWDEISYDEIDKIEENVHKEIEELIETVKDLNLNIIIVSNELGMGIVPENRLARIFRDIAGRANQKIANLSDEAYLVVSGQKIKIKWGG